MAKSHVNTWDDVDQESNAVAIFMNKLYEKDKLHYDVLFQYLLTIPDFGIKEGFHNLTASQKQKFFKTKPLYFVVCDDYVSVQEKFLKPSGGVYPKFCSAINFLLKCFDCLHYLDIKKHLTFVFEDIGRYIFQLSTENETALINSVPNIMLDKCGVLMLTSSCEVRTKHISVDERILLAIVCCLELYGETHFEKLFKKIKMLAPTEFGLVLSNCSASEQLNFLKRHVDCFQVHKDGFVELYEKYASYKCDYQKARPKNCSSIISRKENFETDNVAVVQSDSLASHSIKVTQETINNMNPEKQKIGNAYDVKIDLNCEKERLDTNSYLYKKLFTAVTFLLNCFDPLHYLELKECISYTFKDMGDFLLELPPSIQKEAFKKIPFTTMNENGFIQLTESCRLNSILVTKDEMLLLFIVYYLAKSGGTHFEKLIEEVTNRAPQIISMIFTHSSPSEQLQYLKKYPQHFRIDKDGILELPGSFVFPHSVCKESQSNVKKESFEAGVSYQKKNSTVTKDSSNIVTEQMSVVKGKSSSTDTNVSNSVIEQKHNFTFHQTIHDTNMISKRINSSVSYLLMFFEVTQRHQLFRVILQVLNDVRTHVLSLTAVDKVHFIQSVFLPFVVNEAQNKTSFCSLIKNLSILSKIEQELLYFCYSTYFFGKTHYRQLFDKFTEHNKYVPNHISSDSDMHQYFKKFQHIFSIEDDGIVESCPLPDLELDSILFPDVFKYDDVTSALDNENSVAKLDVSKNESTCDVSLIEDAIPNIYGECVNRKPKGVDSIMYKKTCEAVTFLLRCFGPLHYLNLKECISNVLSIVGIFLKDLSPEKQLEIFSSVSTAKMNKKGWLQLTTPYQFDSSYVSKTSMCYLFVVCYLALHGKTHYKKLFEDFLKSAPREVSCMFIDSSDPKWFGYLKKGYKYFEFRSSGLLELPTHFVLLVCDDPTSNLDELSQIYSSLHGKNNDAGNQNYLTSRNIEQEMNALSGIASKITGNSKQIQKQDNIVKLEKQPSLSSKAISAFKFGTLHQKLSGPSSINIKQKISDLDGIACKITRNEKQNDDCMKLENQTHLSNNVKSVFKFGALYQTLPETLQSSNFQKDETFLLGHSKTTSGASARRTNPFIPKVEIIEANKNECSKKFLAASDEKSSQLQQLSSKYVFTFLKQETTAAEDCNTTSNSFKYFNSSVNIDGLKTQKESIADQNICQRSSTDECFDNTQKDMVPDIIDIWKKSKGVSGSSLSSEPQTEVAKERLIAKAKRINPSLNLNLQKLTEKPTVTNKSLPTNSKTAIQSEKISNSIQACNIKKVAHIEHVSKFQDTESEIYAIVRMGITYLLRYFKQTVNQHLISVVLHALCDVKFKFFFLSASNQADLVKKIILSFTCTEKSNSPDVCKTSSETMKLNQEQKDSLFITYILSHSEKMYYRKVFDKFKEHKKLFPYNLSSESDEYHYFRDRDILYSIEGSGYVKLCDFSPVDFDFLTSDSNSIGLQGSKFQGSKLDAGSICASDGVKCPKLQSLITKVSNQSIKSKGIKNETLVEEQSLKYLSEKIHDSTVHLSQYFDLKLNTQLLRTILHVLPKCNKEFFMLSSILQHKVVEKSFYDLHINEQRTVYLSSLVLKKTLKLTRKEKELLCVSYILGRCDYMHYRQVFKKYNECVEHFNLTDSKQFWYFKTQDDLFSISGNGYVRLNSLPHISVDYKPVSEAIKNIQKLNSSEKSHAGPISSNKVDTVKVSISEPCSRQNPSILEGETLVGKPGLVMPIESPSSMQCSNEKTEILKDKTSEESSFKKIRDSISYLLHYFELTAHYHLVCFILHVLQDAKSYFLNLQESSQDDFMNKCLLNLDLNSNGLILNSPITSRPSTLSNEEKDILFIAYLIQQDGELHYRKVFDKFDEYNRRRPVCISSYYDQHKYIAKWKNIFTLSVNGYVKLLPLPKLGQNPTDLSGKMPCRNTDVSTVFNSSCNEKRNYEGKDNWRRVVTNLTGLKGNNKKLSQKSTKENSRVICNDPNPGEHIKRFCKRIKESVMFLSQHFERVSNDQIVKTIFHVLHDVRNCIIDETSCYKQALGKIYSFFDFDQKNCPMDNNSLESNNLNEEEKDMLMTFCILIQSGPMHYLKLFKRSATYGRYTSKLLSARDQYLYFEKRKNYFFINSNGVVSLNEDPSMSALNFFNDMNLKSSFKCAVAEGGLKDEQAKVNSVPPSDVKPSLRCTQQDAVYKITNICNDILCYSTKMQDNVKLLQKTVDSQQSDGLLKTEVEPSGESVAMENETLSNTSECILMLRNPKIEHKDVSKVNPNKTVSTVSSGVYNTRRMLSEKSVQLDACNPKLCEISDDSRLLKTSELKSLGLQMSAKDLNICQNDSSPEQSSLNSDIIFKQDESYCDKLIDSFLAMTCIDKTENKPSECNSHSSDRNNPIFNLLELRSSRMSGATCLETIEPGTCESEVETECFGSCTEDSAKELKAMNFFVVILRQYNMGVPLSLLSKNLMMASKEVQHYMSCCYKNDTHRFLSNHETFYVSPSTGNVYLKSSRSY